jgi:hypothetical protein
MGIWDDHPPIVDGPGGRERGLPVRGDRNCLRSCGAARSRVPRRGGTRWAKTGWMRTRVVLTVFA